MPVGESETGNIDAGAFGAAARGLAGRSAAAAQRRRVRELPLRRGRRWRPGGVGDRVDRLSALKDPYDPANFFGLNANIPTER